VVCGMKSKKVLLVIVSLLLIGVASSYAGTNTKAYTTITNKAQVKWDNSYSSDLVTAGKN